METDSIGPRKRRRSDAVRDSEAGGGAKNAPEEAPGALPTSPRQAESIACFSECTALPTSFPGSEEGRYSEGTRQAFRLLLGYCKLYGHRKEKGLINRHMLNYFSLLVLYYGFPSKMLQFKFDSALLKDASKTVPLRNISLLLKELDLLERYISENVWSKYYLKLQYDSKKVLRRFRHNPIVEGTLTSFREKVLRKIYKIRETVVARDWSGLGYELATLELHDRIDVNDHRIVYDSYVRDWARYRIYAFEIFHAGLQRILFYELPDKETSEEIFKFSKTFLRLDPCNSFTFRRLRLAIFVDLNVASILYNKPDFQLFLSQDSELRSVIRDLEDNTVLQIYTMIAKYEQWHKESWKSEDRAMFMAEQLELMLADATGDASLVLLDPIMHCLVFAKKSEQLAKLLVERCNQNPGVLRHCYHRVVQLGDQKTADRVMLDTFADNVDLHPSDPLWIEFVQSRTLEPESFGLVHDILVKNVEILLGFLDFGSNRREERAWVLLCKNMEALSLLEGGLSIIGQKWEERKDWWPTFHVVELFPAGKDARTEVFRMLFAL